MQEAMLAQYQAVVEAYADRGYYPAVAVDTFHGSPMLVCAQGHRWGSINPEQGCPTCRDRHKYRLAGRPDCEAVGCTEVVMCSDRAFEDGVRTCRRHWEEARANEWNAGPICLDDYVTVFAQYSNQRWNGWLMPRLDAYGVMQVAERMTGFEFNDEYRFRWLDDGALELTDASQGEDELYVEVLHPDEDGLYALGAGSWTWSEDPDYGATDEWQAWAREATDVWIKGNNDNNQRLIEGGVMDRRASNEAAASEARTVWLKDHPEPPKYPDGRTTWHRVPGEKETA
jgi:hypothetical protein